jgi:hypothetical protein
VEEGGRKQIEPTPWAPSAAFGYIGTRLGRGTAREGRCMAKKRTASLKLAFHARRGHAPLKPKAPACT